MLRPRNIFAFLLLSILTFSLTSCGVLSTPMPTPDTTAVVDSARKTVVAEITLAALQNPSSTPTALPTYTPYPTYTPIPPTETPIGDTPTPEPTATQQIVGDYAQPLYTSTYPENRREYFANEIFNIAWGFRNIGTTTWNTGYALVYTGGDKFTNVDTIPLDRIVAPGEKAEFNLGAFGSEDIRTHTTYWALINDKGKLVPGGAVYFSYTGK